MSEQRSTGVESGGDDGVGDGDRGGPSVDPWSIQLDALGAFIRAQRQLANLSLREMANLSSVSNAYLSQIERGLHQPSLKVLRSIAEALNLSIEQLLAQTGWGRSDGRTENGRRSRRRDDRTSERPDPETDGSRRQRAGYRNASAGETEEAIRRDPALTEAQRDALLGVYRGFLAATSSSDRG